MKKLSPDHKAISDFRKDNRGALKEVFKEFIIICKKLELFGNELLTVDSSKFKANNAHDRVLNKEQISKSIKRINESIEKYIDELDQNDREESIDTKVIDKNDRYKEKERGSKKPKGKTRER